MLASMNGHTSTVKLLLDMGADINAQIETNRNTALTLACFQGRHEVVSLLVERRANIEHRAKVGNSENFGVETSMDAFTGRGRGRGGGGGGGVRQRGGWRGRRRDR